ncbi:MAG: nucleotidyltransferase domain-containing protein, partial [Cyclobacteriaceae bacterium]
MFTIRIAKQIVGKLIEDLRENGYNPARVILFGSLAKGKAYAHSDIDVAIWDERFTGCRPIDIEAIVKILHSYPRVEVHTLRWSNKSGHKSDINLCNHGEEKTTSQIRQPVQRRSLTAIGQWARRP